MLEHSITKVSAILFKCIYCILIIIVNLVSHSCDKDEQPPCTSLSEVLEGLSEHVRDSHVRFLIRRECVLDTLHTVQWPNFCVYDCIVVSLSFLYVAQYKCLYYYVCRGFD